MKLLNSHSIAGFVAGGAICLTACFSIGTDDAERVKKQRPVVPSATVSPEVPAALPFCGKEIDLTRYDRHEGVDRELSSFTYFHSTTMLLIKRANRYFPIIEPILKANHVPDDFKYLAVIESSLNPRAVSPAKAAGLWQFMAKTAQQYGLEVNSEVDERYHVEKATVAACQYLKDAYARFGDWPTTCASYNAGQARISTEQDRQQVQSSFDMLLVSETSRYVFRILAAKLFLENPSAYNFHFKKEHFYHTVRTKDVVVNTSVSDWAAWAKEHGITYSQLKDFNPWLVSRSLANPQGKIYTVRVPLKEDLHFNIQKVHVHNANWLK